MIQPEFCDGRLPQFRSDFFQISSANNFERADQKAWRLTEGSGTDARDMTSVPCNNCPPGSMPFVPTKTGWYGANTPWRELIAGPRNVRMIFGVSATKSAVVVVETKGKGETFAITAIRPTPFEVGSGEDLAKLLERLADIFNRGGGGAKSTVALLKCSSGRFGSCLEAIKGEAMVELAAFQHGVCVARVAPQSLKKSLSCAAGQKWRDRAAELFNPGGKCQNWSKGAAGAAAVAFKIAGG